MTLAHRPNGRPPQIATDTLFVDPGEAWNAQATKIEPSAGVLAQGAVPDQPINAEFVNFRDNDAGRRLLALDLAEVQNFTEPGDGKGTITATGGNVGVRGMAWLKGQSTTLPRILVATNGESVLASIDGGYTWTTEYIPVALADFIDLTDRNSNQTAGAIYLDVTAGLHKFARVGSTGAWVNATATGASSLNAVTGDDYNGDYFWAVGDAAGSGYLRRWTDDAAPAATTFDVASFPLLYVAAGPGLVLAASATKVFQVAAPGGAATPATLLHTHTGAGVIVGLVYLPIQDTFILFTSDFAAGTAAIYRKYGGSFVLVGAATSALFGVIAGSCHARGATLMSSGTKNNAGTFLHISGDGGITWEIIPDPLARHQSMAASKTTVRIRGIGNRIMCASNATAGVCSHALSLRGGPVA